LLVGNDPMMPAVHAAVTRAGVDTPVIGAAIAGSERGPRSSTTGRRGASTWFSEVTVMLRRFSCMALKYKLLDLNVPVVVGCPL
jgi:hypothetical protein